MTKEAPMTYNKTASSCARRPFGIRNLSFVILSFFAHAFLPVPNSIAQTDPPPNLTAKAATEGRVWGALIYASQSKSDKNQETPYFPKLAQRLGKAFAFTNFEILGQHEQVVFREYESWVVPSKDLFLKLDSKGSTKNGGLKLHMQFWQSQKVLVKSDVVLQSESPLFIGGPKWRDGRLIFVLVLKKPEAPK